MSASLRCRGACRRVRPPVVAAGVGPAHRSSAGHVRRGRSGYGPSQRRSAVGGDAGAHRDRAGSRAGGAGGTGMGTGPENLWVHVDSDGVIDWAGMVDPTVRVLPDDPYFADDDDCLRDGVVRLPSEAALTTWVAHRCHRTLQPLFAKLHAVSGGAILVATMWHIVGSMVVAAATQVPQLAGADELTAMRRGQAVLDALVGFGLPVRGPSALRSGTQTSCEIRTALPMLLASSDR